jgi:abhydrolase domain-containing protein 2
MINSTLETYPATRAVVVGFSMGANIVIKYLGEKGIHVPKQILGGISICQGYDALKYNQPSYIITSTTYIAIILFIVSYYRGMQHMLLWANFRRFYLYVMTENMKRVLMAHQQLVLTEDVKSRYELCERSIFSAASLPEFDEAYTRYKP